MKVSAVIVTYGRRWHLLSQVLNAIKNNDLVVDIIIVDNGSEENIEELCKALNKDKIKVIRIKKNSGSAGGFRAGLEFVFNNGKGEFILLLDDDNIPQLDCISNLLYHYKLLGNNKNNCLKAYKYNNKSDVNLANYPQMSDMENSFFNFHIKNLFKRNGLKGNDNLEVVKVKGVAYSGFFFHISLLKDLGFPKEEMILYGDDTEYSLRFTYNGKNIFLCKQCKIKDLEISWQHHIYKCSPYFSPNSSIIRTFYGVRNRVYVEREYLISNLLVYTTNFFIYFLYNTFKALLLEKNKKEVMGRIFLFIKALKDGLMGNLGMKMDLRDV